VVKPAQSRKPRNQGQPRDVPITEIRRNRPKAQGKEEVMPCLADVGDATILARQLQVEIASSPIEERNVPRLEVRSNVFLKSESLLELPDPTESRPDTAAMNPVGGENQIEIGDGAG
jgi:hypothetical protein